MTYVILTLSNPWKVDSMEVEMAQLTTSIKEITMVSMQQRLCTCLIVSLILYRLR